MAVAPMPPQPGRETCYAVLLMDLSSDPALPPEQYSRERRQAIKESERQRRTSKPAFADVKAPARGYAFIPDLLKPLDDIYPCHGGCEDVHLTPAREKLAWTADAGKKTQEELSALFLEAMHSFQCVGFCLADDNDHDLPLVWINDGFIKLSEYSRQQLIGYNCRFLQADATDPDTVRALLLSPVPQACHLARPACKPMCIVHPPVCPGGTDQGRHPGGARRARDAVEHDCQAGGLLELPRHLPGPPQPLLPQRAGRACIHMKCSLQP